MTSHPAIKETYHFYHRLHPISPQELCDEIWLVNNGANYCWSACVKAETPEGALLALQQKIAKKGRLARFVTWQEDTPPPQEIRPGDVLVGERNAWMLLPSGQFHLLSYVSSQEAGWYERHHSAVCRVSWDLRGERLAASDGSGRVLIHQQGTSCSSLYERHVSHAVHALAWSPRGSLIASGDSHNEVHLWQVVSEPCTSDASIGRIVICRPGQGGAQDRHQDVTSLAWDPLARYLLIGRADGLLSLGEGESGEIIYQKQFHASRVTEVAWSSDGENFLSAGADGTIALGAATAAGLHVRHVLRHDQSITSAAWSPDGRQLVSATQQEQALYIWDSLAGKLRLRIPLSISFARLLTAFAVAWSPDAKYIAAGCSDGTVQFVDVDQQKHVLSYRIFDGYASVTAVAWSPDGRRIVAGYDDGCGGQASVRVWPRPV